MDIPLDVGDFRLVSRRVADQLRSMKEKDRFVRGLVSWVGFRQVAVDYQRDARFAGATKYPLRKMLRFALDGITSFTTSPLRSGLLAPASPRPALPFLYLLSIPDPVALRQSPFPGFSTIMVAILFLGGVQADLLGNHRRVHRPHLQRDEAPPPLHRRRGDKRARARPWSERRPGEAALCRQSHGRRGQAPPGSPHR